MHRGIDVSNHQGSVDFTRVAAAGYRFVYIKASEGIGYEDPRCRGRHHEARDAGMHAGFYHFLRPQAGRSGAREAEYFWGIVNGVKGGEHGAELLRLAADIEVTTMAAPETREYARDFLTRLSDLAGHRPVLYTFPAFLDYWGEELASYPLWIAHYGVTWPTVPRPFDRWGIWQYTSTGLVPGVDGNCDVNRCPELAPFILERNEY